MNPEKANQLEAAINQLPRVQLASVRPTPLEPMPRLSRVLGGPPLYIKRDDLTGLAFGGNKTRMLEFGLADALEKGADTIVFGAAAQSNYCRQMAAACAKFGLELHLLLRPERPIDREESQGNNLLQRLFGAHVTVLDHRDRPKQKEQINARRRELEARGRKVYWPRRDDTADLDALAYAEAALEIARQCPQLDIAPDLLYAAALDTTQAGIVLGLKYLESPLLMRGICPFQDMPERCADMADLANKGARRLALDIELTAADFDSDDSFVGERYGIPTQAGLEAIRLVAQSEGILLDPVYTGKAMSALIAHIRDGKLPADKPVIFLHTGGAPALFAYARDVLEGL